MSRSYNVGAPVASSFTAHGTLLRKMARGTCVGENVARQKAFTDEQEPLKYCDNDAAKTIAR